LWDFFNLLPFEVDSILILFSKYYHATMVSNFENYH